MPFRCNYCQQSYCEEHRLPENHNCSGITKTSPNNVMTSIPVAEVSEDHVSQPQEPSGVRIGLRTVYTFLLILVVLSGVFIWETAYGRGYDQGISLGLEEGDAEGLPIGNSKGINQGYVDGESAGYTEGLKQGHVTGVTAGRQNGYTAGKNAEYIVGYTQGHYDGNLTSYERYLESYQQGFSDIEGRSFNIRNPTSSEMWDFLCYDTTDRLAYIPGKFVCHDYSLRFKKNAFDAGYHCFYVLVNFGSSAHAVIAFNTTDSGLIFVEPQLDMIVTLKIEKSYSGQNGFKKIPGDTINGYKLVS